MISGWPPLTECPSTGSVIRATPSAILFLALFAAALAGCEAKLDLGSTCIFTSECPEPLACRNARCRVECVTARDCPPGSVCLAAEGSTAACQIPSVDVCEDTSACGGLLTCADGLCTNACAGDGDCLPGARCSASAGCVECLEAADCPDGLRCAGNVCVPECTADGECAAGQACRSGRCTGGVDAAIPDGGPDGAVLDAGEDAGADAGPGDGGRPPCPTEGCPPPFPSTGEDGDLILTDTSTLVLEPRIYQYGRIEIGPNATLRTSGEGVLDLRAQGEVLVQGTIDLRGGDGGGGGTIRCTTSPAQGGGGVRWPAPWIVRCSASNRPEKRTARISARPTTVCANPCSARTRLTR